MMLAHNFIDMTGQRWGRLTVVKYIESSSGGSRWLCRCDCGTEKIMKGYLLRKGHSTSCGCYKREMLTRERPSAAVTLLAGQRFGRWTLLERAPTRRAVSNHTRWWCICDCGTRRALRATILYRGRSQSCGCLVADKLRERQTTHGMFGTPLYRIWCGMLRRCRNPTDKNYPRYGGRGIKVCERWQQFENFYADIPPRPSPRHSLDRRDNNGHYEPNNVRWATPQEQQNNLRSNRRITFGGETLTGAQWARRLGISKNRFYERLRLGWSVEEAILYNDAADKYLPLPKRQHLRRRERLALFSSHGGICCICAGPISIDEPWQREHIIALCLGGSDDLSNCGVAHERCAIEKTKLDKAEWVRRRRRHHVESSKLRDLLASRPA